MDHSRPKSFSTKDCVVGLCKFKVKQKTYKIGCFLSICPHQYANSKDDDEFVCFIRNEHNKCEDRENVNLIVVKNQINHDEGECTSKDTHAPKNILIKVSLIQKQILVLACLNTE